MFTIPFWIALVISLILVPVIRRLSFNYGGIAAPRTDRWHSRPTPKIGGVAIFISFSLGIIISYSFIGEGQMQWGLIIGSLMIFTLGLYDDFKQISPTGKLIGQILAATVVLLFGRNINFFPWEILNVLFSIVWLVGITNAINLLDNMDGLAGGITLIAAGLMSFLFWQTGKTDLLIISLSLAGGILGFLIFNFPPASIFMGDSGSLFLGFTLASLAIARKPQASNLLAVLGVPLLIFLLPILDTTLVTITRILRGQSPTQGGKDHTSHRLIAFGLSERQVVLSLYLVTFISGIAGTVLESLDYEISLVLIPILLLILTLITAYLGRIKIVHPSSTPTPRGSMTRLMVGLTMKGRLLEVVLDIFLISISYYLAFWTRFGLTIDPSNMEFFLRTLPIALAGTYLSFFTFGIYRGIWQYIGIADLMLYARAVIGAVFVISIAVLFIFPETTFPTAVFILFTFYLLFSLAGSRSSFKMLDQIFRQQSRAQDHESNVLIFGANDDGLLAITLIRRSSDTNYRIVGFLDDDPFIQGRQIQGLKVLGGINQLDEIKTKANVEGIILPPETKMGDERIKELIERIHASGLWTKLLSIEFRVID